jgi:hypothetical protein
MPNSLYGRAAAAAVVALVAGVALAAGVREVLPLGAAYPLKATVCFAVVAAIAVGRINRANHPFAEFGPANQVTAARAVFVGLIAGLIGEVSEPAVAAVAAAGAIAVTAMDGVDGWLARRTKMSSAFGARFDMEVDALLILILSVLAWQYEKAGAWVMLSGLLRYVFVLAGWVWPWMERPLEPSRRRHPARQQRRRGIRTRRACRIVPHRHTMARATPTRAGGLASLSSSAGTGA